MTVSEGRIATERELFIRSFLGAEPAARVAAALAAVIEDVDVRPGDVLFRAGEPASDVYFVVNGAVELSREGEEPWRLGGQSIVGIIDCSLQRACSRTVVAIEPGHVLRLSFADYMDVMEEHPDAALRLVVWGAAQNRDLAARVGAPLLFFGAENPSDPTLSEERLDWDDPIQRLIALRAVPALSRAPIQALASLGRVAQVRRVAEGEHLLSMSARPAVLYVLVEGSVRLRAPGLDVRIGPARILGDLAALGSEPCLYDFVAETDAVTLTLLREDLYDVVEDHFGLVRSLFARISEQRERLLAAAHGTPPSE